MKRRHWQIERVGGWPIRWRDERGAATAEYAIATLAAGGFGLALGLINAFLIHQFRIISIVVTISTFNAFFGRHHSPGAFKSKRLGDNRNG